MEKEKFDGGLKASLHSVETILKILNTNHFLKMREFFRGVFEITYECDDKIDDPETSGDITPILDKFEKDLTGFLRKHGYDNDFYVKRLRELWEQETFVLENLDTLEKSELLEKIRYILSRKSSDHELCFEYSKDYSTFAQMEGYDKVFEELFELFKAVHPLVEITCEISDIEKDLQAGSYNTIIVMKKKGMNEEKIKGFIREYSSGQVEKAKKAAKELEEYNLRVKVPQLDGVILHNKIWRKIFGYGFAFSHLVDGSRVPYKRFIERYPLLVEYYCKVIDGNIDKALQRA